MEIDNQRVYFDPLDVVKITFSKSEVGNFKFIPAHTKYERFLFFKIPIEVGDRWLKNEGKSYEYYYTLQDIYDWEINRYRNAYFDENTKEIRYKSVVKIYLKNLEDPIKIYNKNDQDGLDYINSLLPKVKKELELIINE